MTYLDLINKVLVRLREDTINEQQLESNPYFKSIGAHVNDAKRQVEDSWQWSQLRGIDSIPLPFNQSQVELPNTYDVEYVIKYILVQENANFLRNVSNFQMIQWNANSLNQPVPTGTPAYYATINDAPSGNKRIQVFPPTNADVSLLVQHCRQQEDLVAADDRLKVPSLPVYTLATALASRERGEVGGTPTSELFVQADRHLSDAIAYDSARYPEELIWDSTMIAPETNVRNY